MNSPDCHNVLRDLELSEAEARKLLDELAFDGRTIEFCFSAPAILRSSLRTALLQRARDPSFGPVHLVLGSRAIGQPGVGHLKVEHHLDNAAAFAAAKSSVGSEYSRYIAIHDETGRMLWNDQQVQEALRNGSPYPLA